MNRFTTVIFALTFGIQAAHAAAPQNPPSLTVQFADLDISGTAGARVLYRRLQHAAETVCAPLDDRNLALHLRFNQCVQTAINTAVAKVDRPALTAYHEAHTGKTTIQLAQK